MKKTAPFLIVLAAILWSFDGVIRLRLREIPAATLVMLEHCVGLLLLSPFIPRVLKKIVTIKKKEWFVLFLVSSLGGVLGTIFYTIALAKVNYIPYTVVILLQQTQPIFAIILAYFLLKETITKEYIILASVGLLSAYFLSFPSFFPNLQGNNGELIASLFALGAAISWGAATVLGKFLLGKIDFITITVIRFALAIPIAYVVGKFMGSMSVNEILTKVTMEQWRDLAGIACTAGALSIFIYYKGLQHTPAQVSTILELIYPVSAVFIGYKFLNERLTYIQIAAATTLLLVIFKLAQSQIKARKVQNVTTKST